jgi:sugar phosphate isomerase/epimerase
MNGTRRSFVKALSMAVVSSAFGEERPQGRLPIAFSTLGCPAWDFAKILDFAAQNEFAAVELRGLQGSLDLPSHAIFAAQRMQQTKRDIASHNLRIACVSSSTDLGESDAKKHAAGLKDARRFIDLAAALGSRYVRVFGRSSDSEKPTTPNAELKKQVAAGLRELGNYAGPRGVAVLLESHDDFTAAAVLREIFHLADSPHVGLLWDAYHTFATSNESPELTVQMLKPWIRHTHLKDAVGTGPNRNYVLTGRGNIPVRKQIEVLRATGYNGVFCFEWEKVWHPELQEPETAIADYARVVKGYFADSHL